MFGGGMLGRVDTCVVRVFRPAIPASRTGKPRMLPISAISPIIPINPICTISPISPLLDEAICGETGESSEPCLSVHSLSCAGKLR